MRSPRSQREPRSMRHLVLALFQHLPVVPHEILQNLIGPAPPDASPPDDVERAKRMHQQLSAVARLDGAEQWQLLHHQTVDKPLLGTVRFHRAANCRHEPSANVRFRG